MEKATSNKKKDLFTNKLDLNLRRNIWSMTLFGVDIWTLRKVDQN